MGLAAVAVWLTLSLFVFPFAYALLVFIEKRAEHKRQLREIQQKLADKEKRMKAGNGDQPA